MNVDQHGSLHETDADRRKFRLDTRVSIADLIAFFGILMTCLGIGGPVLMWGGAVTEWQKQSDRTVERLFGQIERMKQEQMSADARQDTLRESLRVEILTELREIRRAVESTNHANGRNNR